MHQPLLLLMRVLETDTVGLKHAYTGSGLRSMVMLAVESYGSTGCLTVQT